MCVAPRQELWGFGKLSPRTVLGAKGKPGRLLGYSTVAKLVWELDLFGPGSHAPTLILRFHF